MSETAHPMMYHKTRINNYSTCTNASIFSALFISSKSHTATHMAGDNNQLNSGAPQTATRWQEMPT